MLAFVLCLLFGGGEKPTYQDPNIHYMSSDEEKRWIDALPKLTDDPKLSLILSRPLIPYNHEVLPRILQDTSKAGSDGVGTSVVLYSGDYNLSMTPKPKYGSPTMDPQWRNTAGFHDDIKVMHYMSLPDTGDIEISRMMTEPVGEPGLGKLVRAIDLVVHKFPVGTTFVEAGFNKVGDELLVFKIRTRTKVKEGTGVDCWSFNSYVPCRDPDEYQNAVIKVSGKRRLFGNLLNPGLFKKNSFEFDGPRFSHTKVSFSGYTTSIPPIEPHLSAAILKNTPFKSQKGHEWANLPDEDCAEPTTDQPDQIFPVGYRGAFFPTNNKTCTKCHADDGKNAFNELGKESWYGYTPGYDNIRSWTPLRLQGSGEVGETPHLDRVLANSPRVKVSGLPVGSTLPRGLQGR